LCGAPDAAREGGPLAPANTAWLPCPRGRLAGRRRDEPNLVDSVFHDAHIDEIAAGRRARD